MNAYTEKIDNLHRATRQQLEFIERHKDFYPIIDSLREFYNTIYLSQYGHTLMASVYLLEADEKTLPLVLKEMILEHSFIETDAEDSSDKETATITFYFRLKEPVFGSGTRPTMQLSVDYSNLCKRVVTGKRKVDEYTYECT